MSITLFRDYGYGMTVQHDVTDRNVTVTETDPQHGRFRRQYNFNSHNPHPLKSRDDYVAWHTQRGWIVL